MIGLCLSRTLVNCAITIIWSAIILVYVGECSLVVNELLPNYNFIYNKAISPQLKMAIRTKLPLQAKFFDELDCKLLAN